MSDTYYLRIVRYIHHQIRQKPDEKFGLPHIIQDTVDYFPYESIYEKTTEEARQYIQDTLSDFAKIYPNAICGEEASIHFLATEFSLRVIISDIINDEESQNIDHLYTYVYSIVYTKG